MKYIALLRGINISGKNKIAMSELKSELFKLRFNLAANGLENPVKIREVKKDIARIKTILKERELNEQK